MTAPNDATIRKLGDSDLTVTPSEQDIRGRNVTDKDGNDIGKVHDLLIDDQQHKVRFLLVEHGGFLGIGEKKSFIPVDAISKITADEVFINHTGQHVADSPAYDPDLVDDRSYHGRVYDYYGYAPYWGSEYRYPGWGANYNTLGYPGHMMD